MINVQVSIGDRLKATVSGDDPKKVIENVAFFSELPDTCPICQSTTVFSFRNPKEYNFYGMRCTGTPAHECTFGQRREGNGLFYKGQDSWDKAYVGDGSGGGDNQGSSEAPAEKVTAPAEDDIPF
jgi:hypothetical protein